MARFYCSQLLAATRFARVKFPTIADFLAPDPGVEP